MFFHLRVWSLVIVDCRASFLLAVHMGLIVVFFFFVFNYASLLICFLALQLPVPCIEVRVICLLLIPRFFRCYFACALIAKYWFLSHDDGDKQQWQESTNRGQAIRGSEREKKELEGNDKPRRPNRKQKHAQKNNDLHYSVPEPEPDRKGRTGFN